jgi:hypothetical protein
MDFAPAPATTNPPKSDDKYAQKSVQLVRVSSFRSDFLQNPYFSSISHIVQFWRFSVVYPNGKPFSIGVDNKCFDSKALRGGA